MIYFIGGFSLAAAVISFIGATRAFLKADYVAGRHNEKLIVLYLIAAAICFK